MAKCLVTGHKGYVGSHLFNSLKKIGHTTYGIDLKDGQDLLRCLPNEEFDYVFHLAALPRVGYSVENPSYTFRQNAYATSVLLEWAKNNGVKRVIFSSSSAVVGDDGEPNSPYGLHKLISEQECKLYSKLYGVDTVSLRYFNIFSKDQQYGGSYSTVICAWMEMIKTRQSLRIDGDGNQRRDFIHVDDVVDANLFCMKYQDNFNGEHYDVGTGKTISLNEIKEIVVKYNQVNFEYVSSRKGDVKVTKADINKLKNIGWFAKIDSRQAIYDCFKIGEIK